MTDTHNPDWEVTVTDVAGRRNGITLVDCRTPQENDFARIEGSLLVPLTEHGVDVEALDAHRSAEVVVYCHTGRRSLIVASILRQAGFENVFSMAGGIDAWSEHIDPSVPKY